MKSIVVCGDLVWDTHVARLPSDPKGYFQPHPRTQLVNRHGGAWYLRDMIEHGLAAERLAVRVLAPELVTHVDIEENKGNSLGIAKGFSVWEWFPGREQPARAVIAKGKVEFKWKGAEANPGAWRIKEFLGCQQAQWEDANDSSRTCPAIKAGRVRPDLVVIDDLGLGFTERESSWPKHLSDPAVAILIKATPPFDNPLWRVLHARRGRPRVTVVVAAEALRDAGARLSRGLSWDRALQEVKEEFLPGGMGFALSDCERVIVSFGTSGAAVFSRLPRSPKEARHVPAYLHFERMLFDPQHLEGTWATDLPGITFGSASALTAIMAAHMSRERPPSSHVPVSRGLAAARQLHRIGGGHDEKGFDLRAADTRLFVVDDHPPEGLFRSAFPRELLDEPVLCRASDLPPLDQQTLLTDVLGLTPAFLTVAAQDIVRFGSKRPLLSVPRLQHGKYLTVDREEIERLNTVRNLIQAYRRNTADTRPLSLAVFGPPGAGKSFAIKELSQSMFGKDQAVLEFNLSQFEDLDALHGAFQEVRDESVQGKLPLVFWDEFDSMRDQVALGWLKEFLAPMQDARFVSRGKAHPFGKCIFIFAGGTRTTFKDFVRPIDKDARRDGEARSAKRVRDDAADRESFRAVKGGDFVSRLRGYVNIKGPNPTTDRGDEVHVIRRALLLRSLVERLHRDLIDPVTEELVVRPTVLRAFLLVGDGREGEGYRHGARSMEAIVSLSRLRGGRHFGPAELPGREVLDQHVTPDFLAKVADTSQYHLTTSDLEDLAKAKHEAWRATKRAAGYVHGPVRDDQARPPTHPLLVDYDRLDPSSKEGNRLPARLTSLRLASLGYRICLADQARGKIDRDPLPLLRLARSEHRRWMRQKLLSGYAWTAGRSDDPLLFHRDVCSFAELEGKEARLDHEIVAVIRAFLTSRGLVLLKASPARARSGRPRASSHRRSRR